MSKEIAGLVVKNIELQERIEALEAERERLWCTACGTVTRDRVCDCNREHNEMSREPHFVNYADAMQEAAHEQAQRIEALEAALRQRDEETKRFENGVNWQMEADRANRLYAAATVRIEALEAALREIRDQYLSPNQSSAIAKAALECISYIPVEPGVNVV